MIVISKATAADFESIKEIAYKTWPITYGSILSDQQLNYMLGFFYSTQKLQQNADAGHQFYIANENDTVVGFVAFEHQRDESLNSHIHKIYILPEKQGSGIGRKLMAFVEEEASRNGSGYLSLNVNRSNPAQHFYRKLGFEIAEIVDIELEHGYLMEDYVMRKRLS